MSTRFRVARAEEGQHQDDRSHEVQYIAECPTRGVARSAKRPTRGEIELDEEAENECADDSEAQLL
jgi:hypothetical protein